MLIRNKKNGSDGQKESKGRCLTPLLTDVGEWWRMIKRWEEKNKMQTFGLRARGQVQEPIREASQDGDRIQFTIGMRFRMTVAVPDPDPMPVLPVGVVKLHQSAVTATSAVTCR